MPLREMSFREKSAWVSFVLLLVIFGAYFYTASRIAAHELEWRTGSHRLVWLIAAFVALEIVLHAALALQAPREAFARRDERELLIEMRATRLAFQVLVLGALGCVGLLHVTSSTWDITQHVLLAVVVAELVKFGAQIVFFRRGV